MIRSSLICGLVGCLITASVALADDSHHDGDHHDGDHAQKREDVRFQCNFRGFLKRELVVCEAHGRIDRKIPHNDFITGERDDFLTVTCGNRLVYDDGVVYGLFSDRNRDPHNGDHHDGDHHDGDHNSTLDGHDDFFDIKVFSITPFKASIHVENACMAGFDGGLNRASLSVSLLDRVPVNLSGSCHFHNEHRDPGHDDHGGDHGGGGHHLN